MTLRYTFLPAIGPYVVSSGTRQRPWRRPIHWITRGSPVFYPHFLASYALWRKDPLPLTREEILEYSDGTAIILGDSGGYTLTTQADTSIDPTEVIRWQRTHCTRGVLLDVPPYRTAAGADQIQFQGLAALYWKESLARTVANVQRALPYYLEALRNGSVFRWWGVIQGETEEQLEEWYTTISRLYPFTGEGEGWALAPKPSTNPISIARYLKFASDHRLAHIHLLQMSGSAAGIAVALAYQSPYIQTLTCDSASALRCAINRAIILPTATGMRFQREIRSLAVDQICQRCGLLGWHCRCPQSSDRAVVDQLEACSCYACRGTQIDAPLTNAEYPHYLLFHNHLTILQVNQWFLAAAEEDADKLLRWTCGDAYSTVRRMWADGIQHRPPSRAQLRPVSLLDRLP